ncbi:MAG: hypothetical protein H6722_32005 [Sandaracinus sp.]|nr:hypothetical protein [Sandaracinus sp.]MCB9617079.1 hypothetical protein [Sandaracinus sp.]MCB9623596.1 hypothetical protein [Sandaracinus sp.]
MHLGRVALAVRLARHLGPWAGEAPRVKRRSFVVEARRERPGFEAWLYEPRGRVDGALLIAPGLHWLGPADPRLDSFCRALSAAGIVVLCPFLPDFEVMRVRSSLGPDLLAAYDAFVASGLVPHARPGVFSISFGSLPALFVGARREIGGLVCFGGFADFEDTLRFCITGRTRHASDARPRPHDPLNACVVLLNLLDHLDADDRPAVAAAWRAYVRQVWGRAHLKHHEAFAPIARRVAERLDGARDRALFLAGVRAIPGAEALLEEGLERRGGTADLDPMPFAAHVEARATATHGRDDDVIPAEHAPLLARALPRGQAFVTGAYAHTGSTPLRELLPRAVAEVRAMRGMVEAIADAATAAG